MNRKKVRALATNRSPYGPGWVRDDPALRSPHPFRTSNIPVIFFALLLSSPFSAKLLGEVNISAESRGAILQSLQKERDLFKAKVYSEEARRRFAHQDWYGTWENIVKSLILAPDDAQALELLIQLLALMDDPSILRKTEAERETGRKFLALTLKRTLNEARALIQERRFSQAAYLLERTIDTISYHPERASCSNLLKEAEEEFIHAHLKEGWVQEMLHRRIAGLLAQAKDYLESGEPLKARILTGLALILEPQDSQARSLYRTITGLYRSAAGKPPVRAAVAPREKGIAPKKRPPRERARDWWRRKEPRGKFAGLVGYWGWQTRIYEKLQEVISIDFTDTPLIDIIDFIRDAADVNIVVDRPGCEDRIFTPITIKLTEVKIESCLRWVLSLADLGYTYRDEAIFISAKELIPEAERVHVAVYDVRDLTAPVADFIGPTMGFGGEGRGDSDSGGRFGE